MNKNAHNVHGGLLLRYVGTEQHRKMTSITSLCSWCNEVHDDVKALNCDLCDTWEHQDCIRQADHLSEELYHSITFRSSS